MSPRLDRAAQEAVAWMVQVHSGEMSEAEREQFQKWRAADAAHEQACRRLERTLGQIPQFGAVPEVRSRLQKPNRRQFMGNALALAGIACTSSWLVNRYTPLDALFADLSTSTGQRQTTTLADGSTLILNARSAVDTRIDNAQRRIELLKGQIHVAVASSAIPLQIATTAGLIQVNSGKLVVIQRSDQVRVAALSAEGVAVSRNNSSLQLAPGTGALMTANDLSPIKINPAAEVAWISGFIEVDNRPLGELIDALRDYRPGILRISPQAAAIRVSGLFPLDNTDFTLDALAQTFPIRVSRTTDYWVTINTA
ncbi:hypothetical protein NS274_02940 [Pseudomonas oryzihabitans]|nr:hypothetical protein NS274_02940 [Pseudomonas psychrotolerans]KTT24374.1 hypothetical protein SB14R_11130 [Pseudomonas psychrotolerans]KTT40162.1 hypothetical protein SB5_08330 [Pseudomonas psychrotolerans]KTT48712.1 hypothetical protein SB11R_14835 [Pseudomonas psychrotolerans]KTT67322.1 hypothetical protein NS383_02210 [Pseudomonas psychrotolerans]